MDHLLSNKKTKHTKHDPRKRTRVFSILHEEYQRLITRFDRTRLYKTVCRAHMDLSKTVFLSPFGVPNYTVISGLPAGRQA